MILGNLKKKISKLLIRTLIKFKKKNFKGLPYLFQNNGSDKLLIIFSAFTGNKRRFNYVSSFKIIKCDKLYVLDPYGVKGSYNLYENGENYPYKTTRMLIDKIIRHGGYKEIFTAGTSKGGTEAIFYGLSIKAKAIFSGACQYNLGTYLWREEFRPIFYGMMGKVAGEKEVKLLNDILRKKLEECSNCKTVVHVFYSKKEKTYERQIIDLLHDLKKYDIPYKDVESDFEKHEDVAYPFVDYVKNYFNNIKNE